MGLVVQADGNRRVDGPGDAACQPDPCCPAHVSWTRLAPAGVRPECEFGRQMKAGVADGVAGACRDIGSEQVHWKSQH